MLNVTLYHADGKTVVLEDVDYVSLVNTSTYGPPPLIAPSRGQDDARAAVDDIVVYINTELVAAFSIERTGD